MNARDAAFAAATGSQQNSSSYSAYKDVNETAEDSRAVQWRRLFDNHPSPPASLQECLLSIELSVFCVVDSNPSFVRCRSEYAMNTKINFLLNIVIFALL